jgi:shikimate kinase
MIDGPIAERAPRIFLVGMMGSGKTTIGRELAAVTGWRYVDNDELVRLQTGREPAEIEASDGEDVLHLAESDALDAAFGLEPPVVIGVAAAVVLDPAAREALREGGHVVWLRARPETLTERVGSGEGRRAAATDPDWMRRRARERALLYADVATRIVEVDDATPAQVVRNILDGLDAAPSG